VLKKVRVDQLRAGVYLHELCGAWLDHPFWKKRFTLSTEAELAALRASRVTECWINVSLGSDVAEAAPAKSAARDPAPPAPAPAIPVPPASASAEAAKPAAEPARPSTAPTASLADEMVRAETLRRRSRESVDALFYDARMGRALDAEACMPLVDDIVASVTRNHGALTSLARLKTHDEYTFMHSVAVCALMVSLARKLELNESGTRQAGLAGLLHDIGKAAMPIDVLNKPGSLTDSEFALIRTHPARGREMLRQGKGVGEIAIDVCAHHHERPDGQGYPDRLSGAALSRFARMGALCDVYDAITSNRPYKCGWDPAESLARMAAWTRLGQFDPVLFHAFVECMGIYPIGSLVRLRSGRLGVVVDQNPGAATAPRVRVFFSTRSGLSVPTETIDLASPRCRDGITGRESNAKWNFPFLDELATGIEQGRARPARARNPDAPAATGGRS